MEIALLVVLLLGAFGMVVLSQWQTRQLMTMMLQQKHDPQQTQQEAKMKLKIENLEKVVGGMYKGMQSMGRQMTNLNKLAGYALTHQVQQPPFSQSGQADTNGPEAHMMLQVRHQGDGSQEVEMVNPEELPEEVLEKLRTFQLVNTAIMNREEFPSRNRPDLN